MPTISSFHARQILDSRGNPTIEVDCTLSDGSFGRAAVPSGASTGSHEALEMRDGEKAVYGGLSVRNAVRNVNDVIDGALDGVDSAEQRGIDQIMIELDGTENKAKLGANAILGASMAVCRARAISEHLPLWRSLSKQFGCVDPTLLPVPLMNVLNGGKHADSGLSFQECMIVPTVFLSFSEALRAGVETFHTLKKLLAKAGHVTAVGDEGGFAPRLTTNRDALELLVTAIREVGYEGKVAIAIDAAASEFCTSGVYTVDGKHLSSSELVQYYVELASAFPIVSIEDSHSEDDWNGFVALTAAIGDRVQIVGDDLFVTNPDRIEEGIKRNAANAVLVKLNQIGTVTETADAILLAQQTGWRAVISHRSGETEDTFISHLAIGLSTGQIKTGSLCRTERTCKYNELLRIEEELGNRALFHSPFQGV